jgi:tRNA(fMet)-specific endonuclease VapC
VNETQNLADPILVDTDVFSYLMRPGDPRGDPYRRHVAGRMNTISHITLGELLFGATWRNWNAARVADMRQKLREVVILPFDAEVCEDYARLKVAILSSGRVMADNDLWIAATAVRHSMPLLSNNRRHFEGVPGLILISEAPQ